MPSLPPAPPQIPPQPNYVAPPLLPAPAKTQFCNQPQQKLLVATPQPGLHFMCGDFKELACCPAQRTYDLAQELLAVSLRPTCWAPHAAQKCAIECDPDAITWDWVDFEGGDPYLCRSTCEKYYVDCLAEAPHTADQPYGFYANMSDYCDERSRDTNCLHVPLSPPSPPPSPPPSTASVVLTLTASGSVSDFSDNDKSSLQQKVATAAGVDKSLVTISVAAGSVLITATIAVPASTTADAVQTSLSSSLGTAADASTALGVTVEEVPTVALGSLPGGPAAPPPPHSELPPLRIPNWVLIFAAMLGVLALCCSFAGFRIRLDKWLLRKKEETQRQEAEVTTAQLQSQP